LSIDNKGVVLINSSLPQTFLACGRRKWHFSRIAQENVFPFCIFRITRNCAARLTRTCTCLSAGIAHIAKVEPVTLSVPNYWSTKIDQYDTPPKIDLTCAVRRHVKVLSRRKCNFSDAVFNPPQFVDIFPDPQLTSLFTIARSKEIGVQCQACDVSALNVSQQYWI
jgi:hypothetical protein